MTNPMELATTLECPKEDIGVPRGVVKTSALFSIAYVERDLWKFIERIVKRITQRDPRRYDARFNAYVETGLYVQTRVMSLD